MTGYVPEQRASILFRKRIEIPATTSTAGGVVALTVPVYDVVWVEVVVSATTNDVYMLISPDTTGGNLLPVDMPVVAGAHEERFWRVVNGVPLNVALAEGSHTVTITVKDLVGGSHGVLSGHIVLHGLRRS